MSNCKTPPNFMDLSGLVFGRLIVVHRVPPEALYGRKRWEPRWMCICVCGQQTIATSKRLLRGLKKSCGCLRREVTGYCNKTHGQTIGGNTRLYRCWRDVVNRCTNPNVKCYPRYGGAGVVICDEWRNSFEAFARDVGEPPDDSLTIDRIDNDKGYEPGNCRWATRTTQSRNRRYCKLNAESAAEVRRRHDEGASYAALASAFGASKSTIAMCCTGATWR